MSPAVLMLLQHGHLHLSLLYMICSWHDFGAVWRKLFKTIFWFIQAPPPPHQHATCYAGT